MSEAVHVVLPQILVAVQYANLAAAFIAAAGCSLTVNQAHAQQVPPASSLEELQL